MLSLVNFHGCITDRWIYESNMKLLGRTPKKNFIEERKGVDGCCDASKEFPFGILGDSGLRTDT